MKPRLLDLFCGAGGASRGLVEAGFDVVGVDINPQPHYPYTFVQADALTFDLEGFDGYWASPPCQRYSTATRDKEKHPDLIAPIRERLATTGKPYVIENVPAAAKQLVEPVMLCGSMFGLGVIRHRYFECSFPIPRLEHVHKGSLVTGEYITVTGHLSGIPAWTRSERAKRGLPLKLRRTESNLAERMAAMGIDWMPAKELSQAIPPAYAKHIGLAMRAAIGA